MPRTLASLAAGLAAVAALVLAVSGCASSSGSASGKLSLVAYSTPKEAYAELIPAFERTQAGRGADFAQSYGASGDQSRAVDNGLAADVVAFSLEPDITRLVKDGLVAPSWNSGPHHGIVADSVVVLAVRKGNPKHITRWSDLTKPGVQVITPNPFTSGGARWNIMAAYGSQIEQGRTPAQAQAYLGALFSHVSVQDKSARDALQTFAGGKGDVLISYEDEAITAQRKGVNLDYVVPDQTILIETPIAVTQDSKHARQANAFVRFLYTPRAQRIFASKGFRPVVPGIKRYPQPKGLFTIARFGGWKAVSDRFFDPQKGIVAGIERKLGVSAGG